MYPYNQIMLFQKEEEKELVHIKWRYMPGALATVFQTTLPASLGG